VIHAICLAAGLGLSSIHGPAVACELRGDHVVCVACPAVALLPAEVVNLRRPGDAGSVGGRVTRVAP
jgi:hypothetical protein